jgi:hypothetical protein
VDAALGSGSSQEAVLVKAVLIRAAYGGMAGDVDMLLACAGMWAARFAGRTLPPPPLPPPPLPPPPLPLPPQPPQPQPQLQPAAAGGAAAGAAAAPPLLLLQQQQQQQGEQGGKHQQQQQHQQQQHQQHQQQQQQQQLPGRKGASDFSRAPAPASPWLLFLRQLYGQLPRPGPSAADAAASTRVTSVAGLSRSAVAAFACRLTMWPGSPAPGVPRRC